MEEINLKELFEYVKDQIVLIMIFILIPILACCFYKSLVEKPVYESTTSIILAGFKTAEDNNSIDNNELTINQKLVTTYQTIAKSKEVINKVIDDLNIKYTYSDLQQRVSVTNVTDTEIIKITVKDYDSSTACEIATKLASVFILKVSEIYNISNASVLDAAEVPEHPSNMSLVKSLVLSAGVGLLLGLVFVVVLFYFDTSIKTAEQIENKFNVVVLGQIPDYNSKKKKGGKK